MSIISRAWDNSRDRSLVAAKAHEDDQAEGKASAERPSFTESAFFSSARAVHSARETTAQRLLISPPPSVPESRGDNSVLDNASACLSESSAESFDVYTRPNLDHERAATTWDRASSSATRHCPSTTRASLRPDDFSASPRTRTSRQDPERTRPSAPRLDLVGTEPFVLPSRLSEANNFSLRPPETATALREEKDRDHFRTISSPVPSTRRRNADTGAAAPTPPLPLPSMFRLTSVE
mmetsp:Transcript_21762/g.64129  ORF Transcript_21762/g.64129 Transcript_21762/m.64129 type:complete len:237 (-) Transcript_21762:1288-1998(-)